MQTKNALLLGIAGTALATGLLEPLQPASRNMALLAQLPALLATVLSYLWYKADVAATRLRTSTSFNGLVIGASFMMLPVYFVRSRGWRRGITTTVLFYACMLAWCFVAVVVLLLRAALMHIG